MLNNILSLFLVAFVLSCGHSHTPIVKYDPFDRNCSTLLAASPERKKVISEIRASTVSVSAVLAEGITSNIIGTGVLLYDKNLGYIILTAEHVAEAVLPDKVEFCSIVSDDCIIIEDGPILEADRGNMGSDWALYKIEKPPKGMKAAVGITEPADLGEDLWLIGHPRGTKAWITHGNLAIIYKNPENKKQLLYGVHGFAAPGFSGGGVYNLQGRLIGIVCAIYIGEEGVPQETSVLVVPLKNMWLLHSVSVPSPSCDQQQPVQ